MIENIGRGSKNEISDLKIGMDFRELKYRREVFLRFYEFHLKYKSHPGGVYFAMPWLAEHFNMDIESKLWMAFINGCSQNIVTTKLIMEQFPTLKGTKIDELNTWWNNNHQKFKAGSGWDSDRKYFKIGRTGFPQCVESYKKAVGKRTQQEMFYKEMEFGNDKYERFELLWEFVRENFMSFGRLSTFSYLEYLRIVGIDIDCNSLFLDDISGSKSHRNGLCRVLGRDDLDWYDVKGSPTEFFDGYSPKVLAWLANEGERLLEDARARINHKDVSYFTLESTLCCYKSWSRPNRRYPNVYMDMMYNRIKYAETQHDPKEVELFWKMRKQCLPEHLRQEDNPSDPGLSKEKQNYYLRTGSPIMMSQDWSIFENEFDTQCWTKTQGLEILYGE